MIELTTGQVYFYIFCKWMTIGFIARLVYELAQMHILTSGYNCKGLKKLTDDIARTKHLAFEAYQKAINVSNNLED